MEVVLYSTNCPKCNMLAKKLDSKGVEYSVFTNVEKMIEMGMQEAPMLEVDGKRMNFVEANSWVNSVLPEVV